MEMFVQRGLSGNLSIPGEMTIAGSHACFTLENKADAIPAGRYRVTVYPSPRFDRLMPLLNGVDKRSDIEIHWGNEPINYRGCIGVGKQRDLSTEEIFHTREMFEELFLPIQAAVETEGAFITIVDPPNPPVILHANDL